MTLHEERDAAWEARIAGRPARTDSPRRAFDDGWAAALSRHPAPVPALDREVVEGAVLGVELYIGPTQGAYIHISESQAKVITDAIMALAPAEVVWTDADVVHITNSQDEYGNPMSMLCGYERVGQEPLNPNQPVCQKCAALSMAERNELRARIEAQP